MSIADVADSGSFVRLIELFPPGLPVPELMRDGQKFDISRRFERLVESISALEALADGFSLPELKDAERFHFNSIGLAAELRRRTGSAVIPTITLRDSNRQNLLGTIAFARFAGIENLLVVRGDPYSDGEARAPKNVYDVRSVSTLVSTIRRLESHLSEQTRICILSPINLQKIHDHKYLEMIKAREFSGVDLFLAESLFEEMGIYLDRIKALRKAGVRVPIIHTIFPLRGYEDALSCVGKFGWNISEEELWMLREKGADYGLAKARERYQGLLSHKDLAQGACISTRGDYEIARLITA